LTKETVQQQKVLPNEDKVLLDNIANVTKGLMAWYAKYLREKLVPSRTSVICDYMLAIRSEVNASKAYRENILNILSKLSIYVNKEFKDFTREDVLRYLDRFRKDESVDPLHKWIGTYNQNLVHISKFFKWVYNPNLDPKSRSKPELRPAVIQNISKLRRKESSGCYKPSDMWDAENNLIFLKYCSSSRDKCYHSIVVDTAARPQEILGLRIKDVGFMEGDDGIKYAIIAINGKTGQRTLALTDSIPYVSQWLSNHPQGTNKEAILLPSTRTDKALQERSLFRIYRYHKEYFTKLLETDNFPPEDKQKIRKLLDKKWNPYVHRHSAITEKLGILKSDAKLRQFAGWTSRSNMQHRYVHLTGGEAMTDLLKAKGVLKEDKLLVNKLQPKPCPNCREPNKPDAQSCLKCGFIMSFQAYQKEKEEREKKDQEILELKEQMSKMQQDFKSYDQMVKATLEHSKELISQKVEKDRKREKAEDERRRILYDMLDRELPGWKSKYYPLIGLDSKPLTKEARKKIEEMLEWMRDNPETDSEDAD
jgi:integrase/recombinase XerD